MGFKGVVITDDVWMRSVSTYCDDSLEKVYVECIKAGNDMVLGVKDFYFDVIEDAVNRGEIPMERIDDACQRVLDLKEKAGLFNDDYELTYGDLDQINADMVDFCERAAKKAISLVCDKNNLFPKHKERVALPMALISHTFGTPSFCLFQDNIGCRENAFSVIR